MSPEAAFVLVVVAFLAGGALVHVVDRLAGRPPRETEAGDRGRR